MSGEGEEFFRPELRGLRAYEAEDAEGLIKLDANENPCPPPAGLMARIGAAAAALELNRYPDPAATALRRVLADRCGWTPEGILLGNGSDDLILLLLAACGGEGATLLVPTPTFSMYRHIALSLGWRVEEVPLTPSFELDEAELLKRAASCSPRLSVFASPNNPTGNLFDRGVMERYLRAAPGIVVIDEAYHDFAGESVVGLLAGHRNLVVLQTLSKIGLAALRLGILLADPQVVGGTQQGAPAVQRRQFFPGRRADGAREPRVSRRSDPHDPRRARAPRRRACAAARGHRVSERREFHPAAHGPALPRGFRGSATTGCPGARPRRQPGDAPRLFEGHGGRASRERCFS